ncbi:MAG: biotin--[acetyl-CoA-carboxylase] ligase [Armatimonadetes bacterium]|nr:biotin--[acetyl-CoA-carboxylase] ligase [Armatimonadota bacterium]
MTSTTPPDNLVHYNEIDSTQDQARRLLADPATAHVRIVLADYQFKGRGRGGRHWYAPVKSALLATLIIPATGFDLDCSRWLSFAAGIVVLQMLEEIGGRPLPVGFRWPNDLICQRRKLGGILIELISTPPIAEYDQAGSSPSSTPPFTALVGVGINLQSTPSQENLPIEAISLKEVFEIADISPPSALPAPTEMARRLLTALEVERIQPTSVGDLVQRWRRRDQSDGFIYRSQSAGKTIIGRACGISSDGALQIQTAEGEIFTTWSASHLPAQ